MRGRTKTKKPTEKKRHKYAKKHRKKTRKSKHTGAKRKSTVKEKEQNTHGERERGGGHAHHFSVGGLPNFLQLALTVKQALLGGHTRLPARYVRGPGEKTREQERNERKEKKRRQAQPQQ